MPARCRIGESKILYYHILSTLLMIDDGYF